MKDKIKILGIAPYEGLKLLMEQVARKRTDIELTAVEGNLRQGAELARIMEKNYDIIISRANTAELIHQSSVRPVVDIGISYYDMLRCIKQAEATKTKFAIIGFHALTKTANILCELMQYQIPIFPLNSPDDPITPMKEALNLGYTTIICDTITYHKAKLMGITPILLTSGIESIDTALDTAVSLCQKNRAVIYENQLLAYMLQSSGNLTIALDDEKNEIYSSEHSPLAMAATNALKKELEQAPPHDHKNFFLQIEKQMYSVHSHYFDDSHRPCTIFHLTSTNIPVTYSKNGIVIYQKQQAQESFLNSFYSATKMSQKLLLTVNQLGETSTPIMITGEIGTGKDRVAHMIYASGVYSNRPLYIINCSRIHEKNWTFLKSSYLSPFTDNHNTVYISNINALDETRQKQLMSMITDSNLHVRNRLILSCQTNYQESLPHIGTRFINGLNCFLLALPPLREQLDDIPSCVGLYLDTLNQQLGRQVVGFEPDAIQKLQAYRWPYNNTQFKRVMKELVITSSSSYITAKAVEELLDRESRLFPGGNTVLPVSFPQNTASLNLNQPLSQINQELAKLVLQQCGGNHSRAAKQLGISRTTLWRYVSE